MKRIFGMIAACVLTLACLFAFVSCGDDCTHRDANDDGKCDACGDEFFDGVDKNDTTDDNTDSCTHRDATDDGKCDKCGADFNDGDEVKAPVYIVKDGKTSYKVIYAEDASRAGATELRATIVLN